MNLRQLLFVFLMTLFSGVMWKAYIEYVKSDSVKVYAHYNFDRLFVWWDFGRVLQAIDASQIDPIEDQSYAQLLELLSLRALPHMKRLTADEKNKTCIHVNKVRSTLNKVPDAHDDLFPLYGLRGVLAYCKS